MFHTIVVLMTQWARPRGRVGQGLWALVVLGPQTCGVRAIQESEGKARASLNASEPASVAASFVCCAVCSGTAFAIKKNKGHAPDDKAGPDRVSQQKEYQAMKTKTAAKTTAAKTTAAKTTAAKTTAAAVANTATGVKAISPATAVAPAAPAKTTKPKTEAAIAREARITAIMAEQSLNKAQATAKYALEKAEAGVARAQYLLEHPEEAKKSKKAKVSAEPIWVEQKDEKGNTELKDRNLFPIAITCSCGEVRYVTASGAREVTQCKPCARKARRARRAGVTKNKTRNLKAIVADAIAQNLFPAAFLKKHGLA
jgi:hypothetical protein